MNQGVRDTKDHRHLWPGIQSVTDYRPTPQPREDNTGFLNLPETVLSQFEENNTTTPTKAPPGSDNVTPGPS